MTMNAIVSDSNITIPTSDSNYHNYDQIGQERVHHTLLQIAMGGPLPPPSHVIMLIAIIRVRIYGIIVMSND